jgi:hypothetical protein
MNPSISTRNLVGGLLGGFAGILFAWYFNPLLLPVGVLFGVVLGWWHSEIAQTIKIAHQRAKHARDGFVQLTGDFIGWAGQSIGMPRWITGMFRWIIAKAILGSIVAITTAPFCHDLLHCCICSVCVSGVNLVRSEKFRGSAIRYALLVIRTWSKYCLPTPRYL